MDDRSIEMQDAPPEKMKVVFTDANNKFQYDHSATSVYVYEETGAKIYLGDQDSCSMVQLESRGISRVIICSSDLHGRAKEKGIKYMKIDPVDNERICLDLSYRFIDNTLSAAQDILLCCSSGLGRSAAIALNFIMKKDNTSLADAHIRLQSRRPGAVTNSKTAGFRPALLQLLLDEEMSARGTRSIVLQGREMSYVDSSTPQKSDENKTETPMPLLPISSSQTLALCRSLDCNMGDGNVFICSYPKSGTTWTQAIVFHLLNMNNTEYAQARSEGLGHISDFSPFYEVDATWKEGRLSDTVQENHRLLKKRVFNTHLLPSMLPSRRYDGKNKFIYVLRQGQDACYSFYLHLRNQDGSGGIGEMSFTEFAEKWLDGNMPYGKWFSHIQAWLNTSNEYSSDLLLLRYQDMVADLPSQVQRIALFLGMKVLSEEELESILPKLNFAGMSRNSHLYTPRSVKWKEGYNFIRKGVVGDSVSHWDGLASHLRVKFDYEAQTVQKSLQKASHYELFKSLLPKKSEE